MEIAGLNESISPVRVRGIIDALCRYNREFSLADFEGIQPWSGLPSVSRAAEFGNLSLVTGHAMMGMNLDPVTGRIIANLPAGNSLLLDIAQLSPDRYQ